MARSRYQKKTVTLTVSPDILAGAKDLAELKEMTLPAYVSDLVWVAVAEHRTALRQAGQQLELPFDDDYDDDYTEETE